MTRYYLELMDGGIVIDVLSAGLFAPLPVYDDADAEAPIIVDWQRHPATPADAPEVDEETARAINTDGRWRWDGKQAVREADPEPNDGAFPVPSVLSMRQAKLQLSRAGLLNDANKAIGTMTGQAGEEARIEWEYATELRRDHPLVAGIGEALKLTVEEIDVLFLEAAKIG